MGDRKQKREALTEAFREAINRLSIENWSNTPDFILAEIAVEAIEAFGKSAARRDEWFARGRWQEERGDG